MRSTWSSTLAGTMAYLNKQFGFNKVFIMNQDVAWARGTAELMIKIVFREDGLGSRGATGISHRSF